MEKYPLTQTQLGIYFDWLKFPDSTIYNIPCLYRLGAQVDMEKLKSALKKVVEAHPYLSVSFEKAENGDIVAVKNRTASVIIPIKNEEPQMEELVRPFDLLSKEPLYRYFPFSWSNRQHLYKGSFDSRSNGRTSSSI